MSTSKYKMGGEITPETLDLINTKINKISAHNDTYKSNDEDKPNGDCAVILAERKNATEYTQTGDNNSVFKKKTDVFFG
ncbi:hypothetical protein SPONL_1206 [uncultured Candidatus Thioglobus sp.]|nr:hypothetical protein SPONL_1206 [uncultured Candidatus Thioglobus sp.]